MWIKQRWKVHLEKYKHNITRNDWQKDKKNQKKSDLSRKISSNSNIFLACVHYCYWQYKFFQITPLWGKHHCFGSRANTQKRDTSMMAKYLISGSYFLPGCASIWVAAEHVRACVSGCVCVFLWPQNEVLKRRDCLRTSLCSSVTHSISALTLASLIQRCCMQRPYVQFNKCQDITDTDYSHDDVCVRGETLRVGCTHDTLCTI